jgi:hypothetical protein
MGFVRGGVAAGCLLIGLAAQSTPAISNQTTTMHLVGSAAMAGDRLRLTPAELFVAGGAWVGTKQQITAGFEMIFEFQLTERGGSGGGPDRFAYVRQTQGLQALAGRGSAGGFAIGDGNGDWSKPGIPHSIAVFFDTFRNREADDPSGNYIALCTNGQVSAMRWPPSRLAVARKLRIRLKDGRRHRAKVVYEPPLMSVCLDGGEPEFRVPVDLSGVVDPSGSAYIGFTASTGDGYENHDILNWTFTPAQAAVSSSISFVQSEIHFLPQNCLPDRNLCTPSSAIVEAKGPDHYEVMLPAHLAWPAIIPNPRNRPVSVTGARGLICFDPAGDGVYSCSGPDGSTSGHQANPSLLSRDHNPGALISETKGGVSRFSANIRKGGASKQNQGFFEFEVRIE